MAQHLLRNIRLAAKSVFFHYKQYLCFFFAIFAVQLLYGIITVAFDNNESIEYRHIAEEYKYHLLLKDLNTDQYVYLVNGGGAVFTSDKVYEMVEATSPDQPGTRNRRYDVYLRFTGEDPEADYARFKERFGTEMAGMSEGGLRYTTTPVLNFDNTRTVNTALYLGISLLLLLLSVFLVTALYNIRINHYKFTYGVYMTFGADFLKLFETSFWEMMTVSAAALPLSSVSAVIVDYFIFSSRSEPFIFRPSAILKVLLFSLFVSAFAVIYPVFIFFRRHPMDLIVAEDNSNLVVSPRMSFEMYGASFPRKYETFALWRFRKYYVRLFATAVFFAALFVLSFQWRGYFAQSYETAQSQFTLTFKETRYANVYDAEKSAAINSIDGVTHVEKSLTTHAGDIRSHILVEGSDTTLFSNLVVYRTAAGANAPDELRGAEYCVTNDAVYHPCDREITDQLGQYKHTGDPNSIHDGPGRIIISDSIFNRRSFKLRPGDTVRVAVYTDRIRDADAMLSGHELLKSELRFYKYKYYEFTVASVLHDDPTAAGASVYMSAEDYGAITGNSAEFRTVSVGVRPGLSPDDIRAIETELRALGSGESVTVTNNHAAHKYDIAMAKAVSPQIIITGLILLSISPLIWFFSQVIFYLKRENEFYVIEMFGAIREEVRRIYITDGIFCAAAASVVYILFSLIGSWSLYGLMNILTTRLWQVTTVRYTYNLPALPFVSGLLLTAAFGFLSAYLPYMLYEKKRDSGAVKAEALGQDGGL
ncbi:MAG: hypothetical protein PHZ09_04900 [Eubacteriales bacterium]|nr:hypothetical protein [Eubacteriales bacterium]